MKGERKKVHEETEGKDINEEKERVEARRLRFAYLFSRLLTEASVPVKKDFESERRLARLQLRLSSNDGYSKPLKIFRNFTPSLYTSLFLHLLRIKLYSTPTRATESAAATRVQTQS